MFFCKEQHELKILVIGQLRYRKDAFYSLCTYT